MSRWDQIAALVEELEALPPSEWATALEERTDDLTLRAEVLSLLQAVEQGSASVLEKPAYEWLPDFGASLAAPVRERLRPGDLLAVRFRIEGFLGRGGMAEVYAAEDRELGERVALKLLHADLANAPGGYVERFRREIRLARRIAHPNVARVYDLVVCEPPVQAQSDAGGAKHAGGALQFYVMELIEGETLAARLRREERVGLVEAAEIARQMADGLGAAHAAGVLHRDFKPSNVMLSAKNRSVVITDFGLAAPLPNLEGGKAETSSLLLGTPGYLAPEQWAGRGASVASDVYAFGIVLHELVTGKHPSGQPLGEDSPLPPEWRKCIAGCLELEPARRWASPADAVRPLWDPAGKVAGRSGVVSPHAPGEVWKRRKWMAMAAAGGVTGMAAIGWSWRYWRRDAVTPVAAKVLFADVENATGDGAYDGFALLLRDQASQSAKILAVSADAVRTLRQRMKNETGPATPAVWREVAVRGGIPLVMFTRLGRGVGEYTLEARLERMGSTPEQPSKEWRAQWAAASPDDVMRLAALAGDWVRDKAGEDADQIRLRSKAPNALTTRSWDALRTFQQAEVAQYSGDQNADVTLYKEALRLDGEFALAAYRVADLLIRRADYDEGLRYWRTALDLTTRKGLSSYELVRVQCSFYDDTQDHERFLHMAQVAAAQWPYDAASHFYLGSAYSRTGNFEASIQSFLTALRIDPAGWAAHAQLGFRYLLVHRAEGVPACVEALRIAGAWQWAKVLEGKAHFAAGDAEQSLNSFEELAREAAGSNDPARWRIQADMYRVLVEADLGRLDRAADIAMASGHLAERNARMGERNQLAYMLAMVWAEIGDADRVRRIVEGMSSFEKEPGAVVAARAVTALARAGLPAEASARLQQMTRQSPEPVAMQLARVRALRHQAAGEVALAIRDFETAQREFSEYDRMQSRELPRSYWFRFELAKGDAARARQRAQALAADRFPFLYLPEATHLGLLRRARNYLTK